MRKISVFNFITLNGYFKGPNDDISWHRHGGEESAYSEEALRADNILLFGRKTFEMMVAFWPTAMARESFPKVADERSRRRRAVSGQTDLR